MSENSDKVKLIRKIRERVNHMSENNLKDGEDHVGEDISLGKVQIGEAEDAVPKEETGGEEEVSSGEESAPKPKEDVSGAEVSESEEDGEGDQEEGEEEGFVADPPQTLKKVEKMRSKKSARTRRRYLRGGTNGRY